MTRQVEGGEHYNFPRAVHKQFTKRLVHKAWGAEVSSISGRVGCPVQNLYDMTIVLKEALELPHVSTKLVQRLLGLLIHPLQHRRELMGSLQSVFKWVDSLGDDWTRWKHVASLQLKLLRLIRIVS